jgi:transcriptional regulator with XRE-family HTH domain
VRSDPESRQRVAEYKHAILDALKLAEIREHQALTQKDLPERLGISQARISQMEHGEDLYLSTLSTYVAALGGRLEIRAVFPEETVILTEPVETHS